MKRLGPWLFLVAVVALAPGCTYLQHRGEDFAEVLDVGVTWSGRPHFALYVGVFAQFVPLGYGHVDGGFAGWGDGRIGAMAYHERALGLIFWGEEELGFDQFDRGDPESVRFQRTGLIGLIQGPFPEPDYFAARHIYVHLGWVGAVLTPRYYQAADFVLGWLGLDIAFDDGRPRGKWGGKNFFGAGPALEEKKPPEPLS